MEQAGRDPSRDPQHDRRWERNDEQYALEGSEGKRGQQVVEAGKRKSQPLPRSRQVLLGMLGE